MSAARKPVFEWREAVMESDLPPTARLVALAMSFDMNSDHPLATRVGPERLARRTGLSVRSVKTQLEVLRSRGWIVRVKRGGGPLGNTSTHHGLLPTSAEVALVQEVHSCNEGSELVQESASVPCAGGAQDLVDLVDLGGENAPLSPLNTAVESVLSRAPAKTYRTRCNELVARLGPLARQHGEQTIVQKVAGLPQGGYLWPSEVLTDIRNALQRSVTCDRCNGTGQTSTGYPCGCPATKRYAGAER